MLRLNAALAPKFSLVIALSLAVMVFSLSGCSSDDNASMAAGSSQEDTKGPHVAVGSDVGDTAPDFTLDRLNGNKLSLSDFEGKTVLVDFWDTWCPPCRRAMPHLQELSVTYGDDLVVIGVAYGREGQAKVESYVAKNNLTFEMVILDESSSILQDFGGIQSLPTTFLIDSDGIIRNRWVGGLDKMTYEKAVVAAINPSL